MLWVLGCCVGGRLGVLDLIECIQVEYGGICVGGWVLALKVGRLGTVYFGL